LPSDQNDVSVPRISHAHEVIELKKGYSSHFLGSLLDRLSFRVGPVLYAANPPPVAQRGQLRTRVGQELRQKIIIVKKIAHRGNDNTNFVARLESFCDSGTLPDLCEFVAGNDGLRKQTDTFRDHVRGKEVEETCRRVLRLPGRRAGADGEEIDLWNVHFRPQ